MDPMPNQHPTSNSASQNRQLAKKKTAVNCWSIDYQRALPLPSATVDIIRQACQLVTGVQYTIQWDMILSYLNSSHFFGRALCQYGLLRDHTDSLLNADLYNYKLNPI